MKLKAAAYVPDDDPDRSWDDASKPLIAWLDQQAISEERAPLLLIDTLQSHGPAGQNYEQTTNRSRNRVQRGRPTFVHAPDAELLELGVNYASGYSIAVVESFSFPLAGWAAAVGAINLWTQEPAPPMPAPMAKA